MASRSVPRDRKVADVVETAVAQHAGCYTTRNHDDGSCFALFLHMWASLFYQKKKWPNWCVFNRIRVGKNIWPVYECFMYLFLQEKNSQPHSYKLKLVCVKHAVKHITYIIKYDWTCSTSCFSWHPICNLYKEFYQKIKSFMIWIWIQIQMRFILFKNASYLLGTNKI